jgi:hypothetical protein
MIADRPNATHPTGPIITEMADDKPVNAPKARPRPNVVFTAPSKVEQRR